MVSFGGLVGGFGEGLESGYRTALAGKQQKLQDYRYGRPHPEEIPDEAAPGGGDGVVPVLDDPTVKPKKSDKPSQAQPDKTAEAAPQGVDTTTTSSIAPSKSADPISTPMRNAGGNSIGQQMYSYFRSVGLSHAAAAGITGNLMQESGGDPRVIGGHRRGDAGASAFAAQWQGPRLNNLYKFAGTQTPSLKQQLDFVLEEMNPNSPFADSQAAAAGQAILGAKTVQDATALFRQHFERPSADDLHSRLNYANGFGDDGSGGGTFAFDNPAAAPAQQAQAEPDLDQDYGGGESGKGGGEGFQASPIPIPDQPELAFTGWQQYAEPEWQETIMAADGGVIPDYDPTAKYDAYNAMVAAGPPKASAPAVGGGGSWTPRRIGTPSPVATPSGPTASQLAFRALPKYQMPDRSQLQTPGQSSQGVTYQPNPTQLQTNIARLKNQVYGQPWESSDHQTQQRISQTNRLHAMQQQNKRQHFAEGGKVDKVKERTRQERTMSSRGDDAGQSARDRAARRTNVEERGVSSTAIDGDGYWKPRGAPSQKNTPRSRAKQSAKKGGSGAAGATGGAGPKYQSTPGDGRVPLPTPRPAPQMSPDLAVSPNRPDNRPAMNAPTNNPPTPRWGPPGRLSPENAQPPLSYEPGASGGGVSAAPAPRPMSPPGGRMSPEYAPGGADPRPRLQPGDFTVQELLDYLGKMMPNPDFGPGTPLPDMYDPGINYAEGGVIPDSPMVSQRALSANYQRPRRQPEAPSAEAEGAEAPEGPDIEPTPRLLADVGKALDGGIRFLTRTFGLDGGGGVVDTPDSPQRRDGGARRMTSGEGRASPQEMQQAYDRVDPQRQMSEGQRYMTTLAKTTMWYLQNGRKEDAEGAAASMMLYGQNRMGQLGSMAQAAYNHYQKTGDPQGLEDTIGYLEKAYEYIPDGGDFEVISLDPKSGSLVTVHRGADGEQQQFEIQPDQIPMLLQQVIGGSSYWRSISALADPEGTRQREKFRFDLAQENRRESRELAKEKRGDARWDYQTGVTQGFQEKQLKNQQDFTSSQTDKSQGFQAAQQEDQQAAARDAAAVAAGRSETAATTENDRRVAADKLKRDQTLEDEKRERTQQLEDKLINEVYLRGRPNKPKAGAVDTATLNPLIQKYMAEAAKGKENQPNIDQAGTALVDAVMEQGGGLKFLTDQGIWPNNDFTYLGNTSGAETPPMGAPEGTERRMGDNGNPIWAHPDPNSPTGWSEWVEGEE